MPTKAMQGPGADNTWAKRGIQMWAREHALSYQRWIISVS